MELLAAIQQSGSTIGTAQDMTFAILLGVFIALAILALFFFRSGHERAHRRQVLREQRRNELSYQRSAQLEAIHEHPAVGEGLPR